MNPCWRGRSPPSFTSRWLGCFLCCFHHRSTSDVQVGCDVTWFEQRSAHDQAFPRKDETRFTHPSRWGFHVIAPGERSKQDSHVIPLSCTAHFLAVIHFTFLLPFSPALARRSRSACCVQLFWPSSAACALSRCDRHPSKSGALNPSAQRHFTPFTAHRPLDKPATPSAAEIPIASGCRHNNTCGCGRRLPHRGPSSPATRRSLLHASPGRHHATPTIPHNSSLLDFGLLSAAFHWTLEQQRH